MKKWCTLCLVIQAVLVLEFIVLFNNNSLAISSINSVYLLIISLLLPTALWAFIKPSLEKVRTLLDLERSVMTYKYNTNLFTKLLENQRFVHTGVSNITAGNPEASVLITMVSNPFCGPCAKAHEALEKLLGGYADYIKVEYIFTGNRQSEEVIKHLCSLPKEQQDEALYDWYKIINYEEWSAKHPAIISQEAENQSLEHKEWSNHAQISHTPTFFINGKELVSPYTIQDLKYHVKELGERVEV